MRFDGTARAAHRFRSVSKAIIADVHRGNVKDFTRGAIDSITQAIGAADRSLGTDRADDLLQVADAPVGVMCVEKRRLPTSNATSVNVPPISTPSRMTGGDVTRESLSNG
jgi:hypothetical protein